MKATDHITVSVVFAVILIAVTMFVIGLNIGRFLTCDEIYRAGNSPEVTYRNGVLLWHPWKIVDPSLIDENDRFHERRSP